MKKWRNIFRIVLAALVVVPMGLFLYLEFALPSAGKPEKIKIELTPERIQRGKYLANNVYVCMDCHSTRDWSKFTGPLVDGTYGKGGEEFNHEGGFPGKFYARNITPFALSSWTDGEILRAIACGVDKYGNALFPVMPYLNYGKAGREDLYSIIAFLRSLKPVENCVPEDKPDFPMSLIENTIPKKARFSKIPDRSDTAAYGAYLLNAAACADCHTMQERGKPLKGMRLAGGFEFPLKTGGIVRSANLTPDKESGIGGWTRESFTDQFQIYADKTYIPNTVGKGDFNTMMPWLMYGNMKIEDLKAIYAYLRTVAPVKNSVIKFSPN